MPSESGSPEDRSQCEARLARVEQDRRHLRLPGRRHRLVCEYYDIACAARAIGAFDLMETCFRGAIEVMTGRRPGRGKRSLGTFSVIAACHNLLGLEHLANQRLSEAAAAFDQAIALRRELQRLFPEDRENVVYLGGALCNRGHASAATNADLAKQCYEESLTVLRQPTQICECSYWDEERQTWWCEQLEAIGAVTGLHWVALAPRFIDNAMEGLRALSGNSDAEP